jgi:hypothetical protein
MSDLPDLARSLLALLEEEFAALKRRDLDEFERLQPIKVNLLTELNAQASGVTQSASLPPEALALLRQSRDAHRRNETLMQHQLAAIRGALQALTANASLQSVEVYDKLGNVQSKRTGRGYGEV